MIRTFAIAAAFAAAFTAGCNQVNQYPPGYQERFMAECQSGGSNAAICACSWDKVRQQFTVQQYDAIDQAARTGQTHADLPKLFEIGFTCATQAQQQAGQQPALPGGAAPSPFGGAQPQAGGFGQPAAPAAGGNSYPAQVRTNFVGSCTGGGTPANICECAYRNIEREFTFPQFIEMDTAASQGQSHPSQPRIQQITQACMTNPNM